ncbi:MAG TPA: carboxypeptidase-like regulatory domain-containing protein [Cyclobacteriaceae bacterium]|nr:carboxypeptidase-like regulatory domain-containing protein [Cyclobacteriaceae bacterium]
MNPKFCLLVLLLVPNSLWAQSHIEISGRVLDQKSKQALPYSNISIRNSPIGIVSNEAGEFDFFVPIELNSDTLQISYIGYKTFKEIISNLKETTSIYLEESPTVLSEITVSGDGARKLVREALEAIPLVYPTTPYLMEGFHRSWEKGDFTDSISYPGTLIEAAITIYDPGYGQTKSRNKAKEEVYINEVRRSAMREGWNYNKNFLRILLDKNLVKYSRASLFVFLESFLNFPNSMTYEWEGATRINDENLSIIKIEAINTKKFPAFYKVYISDDDHAILRFELYGQQKVVDYTLGPWILETFNEIYIFKRYRKTPYLSYAKRQYTTKNVDQIKRKVLRTEDYYGELLINNVITTDVAACRKSLSSQKAKDVSLALQTKEYHADFWKSYNVILENPLDKEIIQYFEQKTKPEDPFIPNGKGKKNR